MGTGSDITVNVLVKGDLSSRTEKKIVRERHWHSFIIIIIIIINSLFTVKLEFKMPSLQEALMGVAKSANTKQMWCTSNVHFLLGRFSFYSFSIQFVFICILIIRKPHPHVPFI